MAIDQAKIEELKTKHGEVHALSAIGEDIIVRKPTRLEWKIFRHSIVDEGKRPDAIENLLLKCTVFPDAVGMETVLDRNPALAETFGNQLVKLIGAGVGVEAKKV